MSSTKRNNPSPPPSSKKHKRKHKHKSSSVPSSSQHPSTSPSTPQLFQKSRLKIHIAVPPACTSVDDFITAHLTSTLLLTHTTHGTIVAFSSFVPVCGIGRIVDECPFAWEWYEGDIVLFNPVVGQRIRGIVTLSSPDHVALITHALFNVSVPKGALPEEWNFEEDSWFDGDGKVVEGEVEFEVDYNEFDTIDVGVVKTFIPGRVNTRQANNGNQNDKGGNASGSPAA